MDKKNQCFVTYDINLKKYLLDKGICDFIYGMNPKTNRLFWVYIRTDELNKCLDIWFNNKK